MSGLNGKTKEVLDACLSSESPEVRAKVYEIINVSGLEADDPMFLILALTGQMRVFLEAAPTELSKLLADWKAHCASSLEEITAAISRVKETQLRTAQTFAESIERVSNKCVENIFEAGMAATSAIASANSETLASAKIARTETREIKEEISRLHTGVENNRQQNEVVSKALLEQTGQTVKKLDKVADKVYYLRAAIKHLQQDTIWVKVSDWASPLSILLIAILIGGTVGWRLAYAKYDVPNSVFAQQVIDWNLDRFIKCFKEGNPKCTIYIVPPPKK
ncbi:conserved hypothetical protein [Hyella patelloides LEGE 07179]|uniref:Uncharacterized protein n=1 Tax=Hyella patelloides LEGE 07179 TaxID=945734 RepID=A0A563VWI8_9CYAN|nr:DUF6753 family protein [Hyella patelloides]VEP15819.1 conserved hypothetical protein [Hyella patelloides LEGE 07179]